MKKISFLPLLALVIAVAASAFTSHKTTATTQWHFEGTQLSQARMAGQYTQNVSSASCGGSTLPCIINVPDDPNRSDEEDLEAYLAGFSSDQALVNATPSKKN